MSLIVQVNDVFAVRLGFRDVNGNMAFNQLHYRVQAIIPTPPAVYTGETVTAVAPVFADEVFDNLSPEWQQLASVNVAWVETMVQSIHPAPRSRQYTVTPALPFEGTNVNDALPLQDTPTIVKRTVNGERWGIGRVFVVGLPEDSQAAGILNPLFQGLVQDFANKLDDNIIVTVNGVNFDFRPVLFGKPAVPGGAPRVTDILSFALSGTTLKTQRRRRPGKGI